MTIPISDLPHPVDEAVDRLHAGISLNEEILLASMTEEDLINTEVTAYEEQ